ncbi:hypothetical protein K490DRAFT_69081 [Saccharata proteae CBS 121410]|uniref:Uncharacterized protein n=1 Tax=Saccharata proteae CBS 121410 TaxID=1314787 RepID=A0A9P4HM51_9PEZI|nr:hypothetical protein K490DRAFT_69081 [Saccharata proteae CBS 121410]
MLSIRASRLIIKALPLSVSSPKALPIRHLSSSAPRNSTPPSPPPPTEKPEGFHEYGVKKGESPPPFNSKAQYSEFNYIPFLLILGGGTLLFSQIVKYREGTAPPQQSSSRSSFN